MSRELTVNGKVFTVGFTAPFTNNEGVTSRTAFMHFWEGNEGRLWGKRIDLTPEMEEETLANVKTGLEANPTWEPKALNDYRDRR